MLWEIPKSSIPYIVGGTNTKDDNGGNSERGYWKNMMYFQRSFAETMNTQLWIPHFGVKIVFDNTFIQQDLQKETAKQLKLGNLMAANTLLRTTGNQISQTKLLRALGLTVQDIEEAKEELMPEREGAFGSENRMADNEVTDSDDKANLRAKKSEEQRNSSRSKGFTPTGR